SSLVYPQGYEVTVTNINVWVKAVDKSGKPVEGLTKDDFQIYEDDQPLSSACFEETRGTQVMAPAEETGETVVKTGPPVVRKFVLFLDLYNTSQQEYDLVKPKMQEFLDQIQGRNWEVMVAALLPSGKLGIIAPFTQDLAAIRSLLDRAPTNAARDQRVRSNNR